ncbi:hypothetical protein BSAF29S_03205 [Bacillus safensis subsp. safensis]
MKRLETNEEDMSGEYVSKDLKINQQLVARSKVSVQVLRQN